MRPGALLAILLAAGCAPALRIEAGEDPARVVVVAPEGRLRMVRIGGEELSIPGDTERQGGTIRFTPRYPLSRGETYRATWESPDGDVATLDHPVPFPPPSPPPRVERIYPTPDLLPANLLKFYLHFSRPMREDPAIFDHLRILEEGRPIADPWRRVELWSEDSTRFTLWIHPGRVKLGVNLREELGPVLVPGKRYTLEIGPGILDGDGRPLGRVYAKSFGVVADDRSRPSPGDWKAAAPAAGTRNPLVVSFPEPLDRWLLVHCLSVAGITGEGESGPDERSWSFVPDRPWKSGRYTLKVDPRLEDLGGNTPERLFEEAVDSPSPPPDRTALEFSIP